MPVTVNISPSQYTTARVGRISTTQQISAGQYFRQLPKEVQDLHSIYPCLYNIGQFMRGATEFLPKFLSSDLLMIGRICGAIKKCLSGIEFEYPSGITILQESYIAQSRVLVFNLQEIILQKSSQPNSNTIANSGISVVLTSKSHRLLELVENWPLFENLYSTNTYVPLGNYNSLLIEILDGIEFKGK